VDAQLPPALARWIERQGHEAAHVTDIGYGTSSDALIRRFCEREGMVLVTKDQDFLPHAAAAQRATGPAVVWLRKGNCSNGSLLTWLTVLWPDILARLQAGEKLVEVHA